MSHALTAASMAAPAPNGAAAYRQRRTAKQMEAEVFARATRSIKEAMTDPGPLVQARAVADNRRLWDAVLMAVLDPGNQLPQGLRAQLAGLSRAVLRECDAEAPDLTFIAEMNEQVAAGLWS